MGAWRFVFLAYGAFWGVMLFYTFTLRRRLKKAEKELSLHPAAAEKR